MRDSHEAKIAEIVKEIASDFKGVDLLVLSRVLSQDNILSLVWNSVPPAERNQPFISAYHALRESWGKPTGPNTSHDSRLDNLEQRVRRLEGHA